MADQYRVTYADVIEAHNAALRNGGGVPGVVNEAAILSAIGRPYVDLSGLTPYPLVEDKAACLLHSIATCHGFADGNKRTAWIVCNGFLYSENCIFWYPDEPHWYDVMETLVKDRWTVDQVLSWVEPCIRHYASEEDVIEAYEEWWK